MTDLEFKIYKEYEKAVKETNTWIKWTILFVIISFIFSIWNFISSYQLALYKSAFESYRVRYNQENKESEENPALPIKTILI